MSNELRVKTSLAQNLENQPVDENKIEPIEQDKGINFYWDNHVTTFEMVTTYTKYAMTWKGEHPKDLKHKIDGTKPVVLVQCDHEPQPGKPTRKSIYFNLLWQKSKSEKNFGKFSNREDKAYLDEKYSSYMHFDQDYNHFVVRHLEPVTGQGECFDVFKDLDKYKFFQAHETREKPLNQSDKEFFVKTIQSDLQNVRKVAFSKNNNFCATLSYDGFNVFDLKSEPKVVQCKPVKKHTIKTEAALKGGERISPYDRLMSMKFGENDKNITELLKCSWVVFRSEMLSAIHFVRLDLFDQRLEEAKNQGETTKVDFLNFWEESKKDSKKKFVEVYIDRANFGKDFFNKIYVQFSDSGKCAIINTPYQKYKVYLDDGKVEFLKSVQQESEVIVFRHTNHDGFLFAQRNEMRQLTFKCDKNIQFAVIDVSLFPREKFKVFDAQIIEVDKNEKEIKKEIRVLAINGASDVLFYQGESKDKKVGKFSPMFPKNLQSISMPYFAYSVGLSKDIYVQQIQGDFFHFKLPEETEEINERLLKIKFTQNSTLIAITEEKDPKTKTLNFFAYLIKSNEFTETSTTKKLKKERRILLKTENQPIELNHAHIFERQDGSFVLILSVNRKLLLLYSAKKQKNEDYEVFHLNSNASEQESKINGVLVALNKTNVQKNPSKPVKEVNFDEEEQVKDIQKMSKGLYIVHFDGSTGLKILRILEEDYSFNDVPINTRKMQIKAMQANEQKIYILLQDSSKRHYLCVNNIKIVENHFEFAETMFLQLENSPDTTSFVDTFCASKRIIDGILIHNEKMYTKIYDNAVLPGIIHVPNYLQNITAPYNKGSVCPDQILRDVKYRKIALVMEFTKSKEKNSQSIDCVRRCVVLPYLDDRRIQLQVKSNYNVTWLESDKDKKKQMYELCFSIINEPNPNFALYKIDLKGLKTPIELKEEEGKTNLKNYQVLTYCDKTRTILATQRDSYLKQLTLLQVKTTGDCENKQTIEFVDNIKFSDKSLPQVLSEDKIKDIVFRLQYDTKSNNFIIAVGLFIFDEENNSRKLLKLSCMTRNSTTSSEWRELNLETPTTPLPASQEISFMLTSEKTIQKWRGFTLEDKKIIVWSTEKIILFKNLAQQENETKSEKGEVVFDTNITAVGNEKYFNSVQIQEVEYRQKPKQGEDLIYIKANFDNDDAIMIGYDLKTKRQIGHVKGTPSAEFFFNEEDECFVYDKLGIINLCSAETFFEYKIKKVPNSLKPKNICHGTRMFNYGDENNKNRLLLLDGMIYLPYSFYSYANKQKSDYDHVNELNFYPQDYYKVNGKTTLMDLRDEPKTLERLLECYWKIDRNYVLTVLVGDNKPTKKETPSSTQDENQKSQQEETKKSVFVNLLELDHAPLINQILFMFSKLPIELSFKLLEPHYGSLIQFARFEEYLSSWFEVNSQLNKIQVVYVPKQTDTQLFHLSNLCFLDSTIDGKFSVQKPNMQNNPDNQEWEAKAASISVISTKWFFTPIQPALDSKKVDQNDDFISADAAKGQAQAMDNKLIEISPFFTKLAESREKIALLNQPNVQALINHLWQTFRIQYTKKVFLPFLLASYIPFIFVALEVSNLNKNNGHVQSFYKAEICEVLLTIYGFYSSYIELKSFKEIKIWYSILTLLNTTFILITIVFYEYLRQFGSQNSELGGDSSIENFNDIFVLGLLTQTSMLLFYLRMYSYFATFVRALSSVFRASLPLLACLLFILLTETLIFYIILGSQTDNQDMEAQNNQPLSFSDTLKQSYMATLGDFRIADNATAGNQMFWGTFFLFTFIQLIIILNMVIAIMSAAFEEVHNLNQANIFVARLQHMVLSYPQILRGKCSEELQRFDYLFLIELNPVQSNLPSMLMAENPLSVTPSDFNGVKADIRQLAELLTDIRQLTELLNVKQVAALSKEAHQD